MRPWAASFRQHRADFAACEDEDEPCEECEESIEEEVSEEAFDEEPTSNE